MSNHSKFLGHRELKAIKTWMKRVKKFKFNHQKLNKENAIEQLKLPYDIIGTGKNRIVYDLKNDKVLKVAIRPIGIKNNKTEVKIYKKANSKVKKHLAKVLASSHGWLIMRKFEKKVPVSEIDRVVRLEKKFIKNGIRPDDMVDKKNKEFRKSNLRLGEKERIVVIDYGNFKIK